MKGTILLKSCARTSRKLVADMLRLLILFIAGYVLAAGPLFAAVMNEAVNPAPGISRSIVQIYALTREPYYANPWVSPAESRSVGTGCIIAGNRILTNAHVIANHTVIEVRKALESKRYTARALFTSHDADLAVLSVDDSSFFQDAAPLDMGELPEPQQKVTIYGFPDGDALTITDGILARIEHKKYMHSSSYLLAGEILSDIRTGNSGGPVIFDNKIAGVIMQANKSGSVAHMVPAPVIEHFLSDIKDRRYDGIPDLGLVTQKQAALNMNLDYSINSSQSGVIVDHVISGSPVEGKIMKDDILLAVNGYPVGNDGAFEFRHDVHIDYTYAAEMLQVGDELNITTLRSGRISNITVTLDKTKKDYLLVPGKQYDTQPRYFIYGGVVFSPLTKNILSEWGRAPEEFAEVLSSWRTPDRREIVVALMVLPDEVNKGYHDLSGLMIEEVNGRTFRDFDEFVYMVSGSYEPYVIFNNNKGKRVVIDTKQARESRSRILRTYSIEDDRSPDLKRLHAKTFTAPRIN